jgi:anaerobic sulfite reductase subunit B
MIYTPKPAKIDKITRLTEDTFLLRVKTRMSHAPGQFVQASLLGIGECPISICSYSKNFVELCIRRVGSVTNALCNLEKGDTVFIRGPYGNGYPMKELEGKELVIVGGGTGVAPLKAVVDYYSKNRKSYSGLSVFVGFSCPEEILFKEEVKKWQKELRTCLLSVDRACDDWKGNIGVVTCLLDKAKINKESAVMICGPPVMIKFVAEKLSSEGVSDKQMYVSMERLMYCGLGKCGHCMINGSFVCKDGPVFRLDETRKLLELR